MDGLREFGDPRDSWHWKTGEVDYVAQLGLSEADVPELLAVAEQWAQDRDWPEDQDDMSPYAPIHAWRALAQLKATQVVGPLLKLLDLLDARGDDWYLHEFPNVFAWIGPVAAPALTDYLADPGHRDFPRSCAAHSLRELAKRYPSVRDEVIQILIDALSRFEDTDTTINAFIVGHLLDMKATEAAEMIERAHAADRVDTEINGTWYYVREAMGVKGLGLVPEHLSRPKPPWAYQRVPSAAPAPLGTPASRNDRGRERKRQERKRKRQNRKKNRRR